MAIRWDKLTVKTQQAIQGAQARAAVLGNPEMQPVHLLLALIEDREGVIPAVLEKIGVPTEQLEHDLNGIEQKLPRVAGAAAQPGLGQAARLRQPHEAASAQSRSGRAPTVPWAHQSFPARRESHLRDPQSAPAKGELAASP